MHIKAGPGFTLIEMIITIVILGIIGLFSFSFLNFFTNTYVTMRNDRNLYQEGVYVVERIAREMRDASTVAVGANTCSMTIPHGTPADGSALVTYTLTSGTINRVSSGAGTIPVSDNVTGFSVTAVTASGLPANTCFLIVITRGTHAPFRSTVCPRNFVAGLNGYGGNYYDTY
jgi:prepilin-type N-terminal cleavage/methylation domain-containing protein